MQLDQSTRCAGVEILRLGTMAVDNCGTGFEPVHGRVRTFVHGRRPGSVDGVGRGLGSGRSIVVHSIERRLVSYPRIRPCYVRASCSRSKVHTGCIVRE
jgi:hypothetical protein